MIIATQLVKSIAFSNTEEIKGKAIQFGQTKKHGYWEAWRSIYVDGDDAYFVRPAMETVNGAATLMAEVFKFPATGATFNVDEVTIQTNQQPDGTVTPFIVSFDELDEYGNWKN